MNLDPKNYEETYTRASKPAYNLFEKLLKVYVENGDTVVDVGAGVGIIGKLISKNKKCEIIGIEPDMESAKISNKQNIPNYSPIVAVGEYMPLVERKADVVTSNHMLHWTPDKEKVIREMVRVLKKKGRGLIGDCCYLDNVTHEEIIRSIENTKKEIGHAHKPEEFIRSEDLSQLLEKYEIKIEKSEEILPHPDIKRKYYVISFVK
jgi:ubiquinone/menaquinone biosynthesis C-methylase UbiE